MSTRKPLIGRIIQQLATQIGARVFLEPEFGHVGQIKCANGSVHYFRNARLDINLLGAAEITKDKEYASFFMSKMGYKTIPGKKFYSEKLIHLTEGALGEEAAWKCALELGLPVVLKPNSKSQGEGVFLVDNEKEFKVRFKFISKIDDIILVQKPILGQDFRILVLDDEVVSAYKRIPLTIIGDGRRTVTELFNNKIDQFESMRRKPKVFLNDERIKSFLQRQNISPDTILKDGAVCHLLFNANLSTGGEAVDMTSNLAPYFKTLAINLTKDMGLRFCGVDLIIDGDGIKESDYHIVEVNASPGVDNYSLLGPHQSKVVKSIYLKILKKICDCK